MHYSLLFSHPHLTCSSLRTDTEFYLLKSFHLFQSMEMYLSHKAQLNAGNLWVTSLRMVIHYVFYLLLSLLLLFFSQSCHLLYMEETQVSKKNVANEQLQGTHILNILQDCFQEGTKQECRLAFFLSALGIGTDFKQPPLPPAFHLLKWKSSITQMHSCEGMIRRLLLKGNRREAARAIDTMSNHPFAQLSALNSLLAIQDRHWDYNMYAKNTTAGRTELQSGTQHQKIRGWT